MEEKNWLEFKECHNEIVHNLNIAFIFTFWCQFFTDI